jgi:CDP-glucose 4,6-dehydratase
MVRTKSPLEDLVMTRIYPNPQFWRNRDVFVTGHTGFKGSWLTIWLHHLGARVHGYSLPAVSGSGGEKSLFDAAGVSELLTSHCEADIRNADLLRQKWKESEATALFHLAAQPLVRESYQRPAETFEVNIQGTVSVLEALKNVRRPAAAVIVTTDKCYENLEEIWGRRETDTLGGHDPYSASKAAAEIVVSAYRRSFFQSPTGSCISIATARAGNVIGGGDWAPERLIPDLARSLIKGQPAKIRNPKAVRPWQHVLEPLAGYLLLAERLWKEPTEPKWRSAWNFGPNPMDLWSVGRLADEFCSAWGDGANWEDVSNPNEPFETSFLHLNTDKALHQMCWRPRWSTSQAVKRTVRWYSASVAAFFNARHSCRLELDDYTGVR